MERIFQESTLTPPQKLLINLTKNIISSQLDIKIEQFTVEEIDAVLEKN